MALLLPRERALFCGDVVPVQGDLPVYDDAKESVRSVRRLRGVTGVNVLLSAWDEPREGDLVYQEMDRALAYLQSIHAAVVTESEDGTSDTMEVTKRAAAALGLPPQMVTPLLARTFAANLRIRNRKDLLADQN
jgi:hydroxyacylglutathione hydrolase